MEASVTTRAKTLITTLARGGMIEVRRVEIVARDFATHIEALERAPSARELERWLEAHPQITELSASDDALEALLVEHLSPPKPPPQTHRNRELEDEIRKTGDRRAIEVYADWLQERNDPFGEQLALGAHGDTDRFARYIRDNAALIFGEHHKELAPLRITWRFGLIDKLGDHIPRNGYNDSYRPVEPIYWAELLQARSCEMLREIQLSHPYTAELDRTLAMYGTNLWSVIINDVGWEMPRLARVPWCKLHLGGHTVNVDSDSFHPELEDLSLHVRDLRFEEPPTWNIQHLHIHATRELVASLRKVNLPRLERLTASGDQALAATLPKYAPPE